MSVAITPRSSWVSSVSSVVSVSSVSPVVSSPASAAGSSLSAGCRPPRRRPRSPPRQPRPPARRLSAGARPPRRRPVASSTAASAGASASGPPPRQPPTAGSSAAWPPSCSTRASINPTRSRSGADSSPSSCVTGATMTPTSWLLSTSSGGSFASSSTSAAAIVLPERMPPRSERTFVVLRRVGQRLRHRDGVAVGLDERDRRRPFEQREQRLRAGRLRGAPGERVLHDRERRPVLAQLRPNAGELRVGQPAVVRHDQRLGLGEPLGQLLDDPFLVSFVHVSFPSEMTRPALRRVTRPRPVGRSP